MPQIQKYLEAYDVTADRKCLYDDLKELKTLGLEVSGEKDGRNFYYYVSNKKFDIAELKLLVDAIQSSKFITLKKSRELISKLESFCSNHEAKELQRQVFVQNRIKTMNESIYYSVDAINSAISHNHKVSFDSWGRD